MKSHSPVGVFACALISLLGLGCEGRIHDASRFTDPAQVFPCADGIDANKDIILARCGVAGCHGSTGSAAGLDLASPDPFSRVYNVPSHNCPNHLLMETTALAAGYLFEKVSEETPACGSRMPFGQPPLSAEEVSCVKRYFAEQFVAAKNDAGPDSPAMDMTVATAQPARSK
jgi:hypothetical protein